MLASRNQHRRLSVRTSEWRYRRSRVMLELFRRISIPHFTEHKLRTALTVIGFALGMMAMVGLRLLFGTAAESYQRTIREIGGKAQLRITNGAAGVPEDLLEKVRGVPGVGIAAASVQGFAPVVGQRGEQLYIFGVDALDDGLRAWQYDGDAKFCPYKGSKIDDPLVFLAKAD